MPANTSSPAIILANGQIADGSFVQAALKFASDGLIVAADGGAHHAERFGLMPDLLIGDLDSISAELLQVLIERKVEVLRFRPEKDFTDLELALLETVKRGSKKIRVLGAFGGRFDQTLANVYLLALPELAPCDVRLVDYNQAVWLLRPGLHEIAGNPGDTISLLPVGGSVRSIRTEGLRYPLDDETLDFGPARGISNVLVDMQARVAFEAGVLLIVHTMGRA